MLINIKRMFRKFFKQKQENYIEIRYCTLYNKFSKFMSTYNITGTYRLTKVKNISFMYTVSKHINMYQNDGVLRLYSADYVFLDLIVRLHLIENYQVSYGN